jgi:hypothetical protein
MAIRPYSSDHIYYDVNITNQENILKPTKIIEDRTVPILLNPSDYDMSIQRLLIPASAIPLMVFTNSPNPFILSMRYLSNPALNISLVYDSSWDPNIVPSGSITSFAQLCAIVNQGFTSLTNNINTIYSTSFIPPYMWFDSYSSLFKIRFNSISEATQLTIYFNYALFEIFPTFPCKQLGVFLPSSLDVQLVMDINNPISQVGNRYDLIQESKALYGTSTIRRIFLKSGLLSTRPEFQYSNEGNDAVEQIVTDFEPNITSDDFRGNAVIQYIPQAEFRRIDLLSSLPLKRIEMEVFWQDKWGYVYPLLLPPNQFMSLKILFEKKIKF